MKAIYYEKYGPPEVLHIREIEKPKPKDSEVLVKIFAASINSWDWDMMTGKPKIYRLFSGIKKPKWPVIGSDIVGRVDSIGKDVTDFVPGDMVYGDISSNGFGAFAEYVCVHEKHLALKPGKLTVLEAAAIPQAGVLALQGLKLGKINQGKKVLINGAGGGVGTFAMQMAKLWGAEVTAVDIAEKLAFLKSLGADHVMDYTKEDFTKTGNKYDLILDMVSDKTSRQYGKALNKNGIVVIIGGQPSKILSNLVFGGWAIRHGKAGILAHKPNRTDLNTLGELCESGKIKPIIDSVYPLNETVSAMRYFGEGQFKGKIVIKI